MEQRRKVAIMTWYAYRNYGSALQAGALYESIRALGYDPCMINYAPKGDAVVLRKPSVSDYASKAWKRLKSRGKRTFVSEEREALFAAYLEQHLTQTAPCNTYPELYELNEEFDAFVCGSDQIWAPVCYDDKYFLSFVKDDQKRVAYAPSIGLPEIKHPVIRKRMAEQIGKFTHLSVRETQGAALINELTNQTAEVVLDPTLLLDAEQWDAFAATAECPRVDGDYIVCYFLGDGDRYKAYVKSLSEATGLPAYVIPVTRQDYGMPAVPFEVGPHEFVSLIRNAKHVCTDSFHGMAFSVNYGTPFTVFKRFADKDPRNQNSRILSLLALLGLEERLVDPTAPCNTTTVDFTNAYAALQERRASSAKYLKEALAAATEEREPSDEYHITDLCCGCGACAAVCPTKAITVSRDEEGFEHYRVNEDTCVRCGRCQVVCPFASVVAPSLREMQALYSVKSTSQEVLKNSSSGGIGYELAKFGLENGTYVCGCTYDRGDNQAHHILLAPGQTDQLSKLQGSKYIQSVSAEALSKIRRLPKGEKLLFFGTPCQTAGVDKLLTALKRRDDAILIDLICHGVPSQYLWDSFLHEIDGKHQTGSHPSVQFRSKEIAWRKLQMTVVGNGNAYKKLEQTDDFYGFFRRGLCYMDTCFDCPYRERSAADIRIGDYWGPRFANDTEGVSMVLTCTERGEQFLELLREEKRITAQAQPTEEYWTVQYPYNHGKPLFREQLIEELKNGEQPLSALRKKYCRSYDVSESVATAVRTAKSLLRKGAKK